jgi:hypothetical protein
MPSLSDHQSSKYTKLILIGDSGTGKTGSLTSLVAAGYKVRVLDTDNGLDSLRAFVKKECPDKINNVDFETRRDEYVATTQGPIVKKATAFVDCLKLMQTWSDESSPQEWGPDTFFVLDSMTGLGKAAFEFAKGLNPAAKDPRQWYHAAQQAIENTIALLTSEAFHANVIVISHITYKEQQDGTTKGWASSIGSALGPTIPKYFNTLVLAERSGFGQNVKRKIKTVPTDTLDLKTAAPFTVDKELPLESGLATLVKALKES